MGKESSKKVSLYASLQKGILGLILVVTFSFLISTYFIADKEQKNYCKRESESVLKTLSSNIYSDIHKYIELSRIIMTEENLVEFLRADADSVDIGMINDARYGVMNVLNVTESVDGVMIFREDMIMVATNRFTYEYDYELMGSDEWKKDIYDGKGSAIVTLNSNKVASKVDKRPLVTVARAIYDIDSQERTGVMLLNISNILFDKMLSQLGYRNICIMGEDGTYLAGNRSYTQFLDKDIAPGRITYKDVSFEGDKMLLSSTRVSDYPIIVMRLAPYSTEGTPYSFIYVLLALLMIFIVMVFFVSGFIRKNITDPVLLLSESMDKNKRTGELKKVDAQMPSDELEMLKEDYNSLIDHVNELIDTLIDKEKTLQRAEMRVLQEQIKPHFLYNSIETIGFMALDAGAENVHEALETLGSFYRNFLSKGDREIPLSREIWIVKDYLALQKLRYGDIMDDEYDIAEDTLQIVVPKLILQPLVENSIYHGIRQKGEKGIIRISSRLENGDLFLTVRDTGVGMSSEEIKEILSTDNKADRSEADSFGLWGTIQRIRLFEGEEDIVKIESEVGEYTQIEFRIKAK
ncbi:two component system histidine kinase [Butyrivibrio proteoclasticus B316]|uniref:Two component system histidine kinase n=1 Tax=Butyrivibrio proteoclasticus (strain ATCC 51982 / DSM 14932 / B316) TaxID=515622 RepID=E0RXM7_BUTPB|nr:sensor histidine kinase [Butyrivibrio proteoclasticus]ADL34454.1 two component system histidine kinase [Butyrivibrio proteoclasticus B316]